MSFRKFPAVMGIVSSNSSIFTSPIVVWRRTVDMACAISALYVKPLWAGGEGRGYPGRMTDNLLKPFPIYRAVGFGGEVARSSKGCGVRLFRGDSPFRAGGRVPPGRRR